MTAGRRSHVACRRQRLAPGIVTLRQQAMCHAHAHELSRPCKIFVRSEVATRDKWAQEPSGLTKEMRLRVAFLLSAK